MIDIEALVHAIRTTPGCMVYPPECLPTIEEGHTLPEDLSAFCQACGGLVLFEGSEYPVRIVSPREVRVANPVIITNWSEEELRAESRDDISWSWYIIAQSLTNPNSEIITIDLDRERLGLCYDSFWDRHPQESEIIAESFTDFLSRSYADRGRWPYWLQPNSKSFGRPYA
jgi:hypothetical protein